MTINRFPPNDLTRGALLLHLACCGVALMSIGLTAFAQEQSPPPQTPPQEGQVPRQEESKPPEASVEPERWNLFYPATSIGDEHGTFHAPYGGPLSLADYPEHDVSVTSTLFFSLRLEQNTVFVFNPEIAPVRPPSLTSHAC